MWSDYNRPYRVTDSQNQDLSQKIIYKILKVSES